MLVTTKIKIDLQRPSYPVVVNAVQGDQNTRQLEISLFSGSVAWMVPDNVAVAMRYCKPDNTNGYYDTMPDGTASFAVSENTVSVLLAPQMLTIPGTVVAQVVLYLGTQTLATFSIYIRVEADPSAGAVTSEDYVNWAQWIKSELDAYLEQLKTNGEFVGGTMAGPIDMNGHPISGLNEPTENDQAANMGFVNQQMKKAAPYNYAHNSDFTQFVAQAGIGGNHGNQAYAGDRWILVSGTVTGTANANGNGYSNIKLNGTIRQKVENPLNAGTAAIEMVSGTAQISYENGEITITSAGGVIKNVRLFDGTHATYLQAVYRPKGYGAELTECMRYFRRIDNTNSRVLCTGVAYNDTQLYCSLPFSMRTQKPSFIFSGLVVSASGISSAPDVTMITTVKSASGITSLLIKTSNLTTGNAYNLWIGTTGGYLEASADL